ncbi:MAG: hypothetical protein KIT84_19010 [Labilithrix sp.]|nr:hypothetical protein [Labilithrix sp.]MCW5813125.1 hypothetical protein [Labilithrix sp.]
MDRRMTPEQEEWISTMVRGGYLTADQIVRALMEDEVDREDLEIDESQLAELVDAKMRERRRELQLAGASAYDRLSDVFDLLEDSGIFARENYWCCQSCAYAAIDEEIAEALEAGEEVRGYVYFHSQDTDRAVESGELLLRFGGLSGEPLRLEREATQQIGEEVTTALEDAGFEVRWSGSPGEAITMTIAWDKPPPAAARDLH